MHKIKEVCFLCDLPLKPIENPIKEKCSVCGIDFTPVATCENSHYVCYNCMQKISRDKIIGHCLNSKATSPLPLAIELMKLEHIPIHGPMHHLLVPAALLTAHANTHPNEINIEKCLIEANKRSFMIPGGACGNWGACGAGLGVGIYLSILEEIGPLSTESWKEVGQLTSSTLSKISKQGGPRCCKRDVYTAIKEAMIHSNINLSTHYEIPSITCQFFINNIQCKKECCQYYPKKI